MLLQPILLHRNVKIHHIIYQEHHSIGLHQHVIFQQAKTFAEELDHLPHRIVADEDTPHLHE